MHGAHNLIIRTLHVPRAVIAGLVGASLAVVGAGVINAEMLRTVFGVGVDIVVDPRTGAPLCIPYRLSPG